MDAPTAASAVADVFVADVSDECLAVAGGSCCCRRCNVVGKEALRRSGTQDWKLNNIALKSIRDSNEDPIGTPAVWGVDLFEQNEFPVLTLVRGHEEAYTLTCLLYTSPSPRD